MYRVLVLLFAIVLIAVGTERMCAEVCPDQVADVLDEDAVIQIADTPSVPARALIVDAPSQPDGIAPAPSVMRVFRPPRTVRG